MALPTYATNLTDIIVEFPNTTNWTSIGGALNTVSAPETDYFIQGANCISKTAGTGTRGYIYNAGTISIPAGEAVFEWLFYSCTNSLAEESAGGYSVLIGSGAAAYNLFYVRGSDTYAFSGWFCVPVDPTVTPSTTPVGSPTSTTAYFGSQIVLPSTGPSKGNPQAMDAIRYGREFRVYNGSVGDGDCTFAGAAAYDNTSTRRWGLLTPRDGAYYQQGLFLMGVATASVRFVDANRSIFIQNTKMVSSAFNAFEIRHTGSVVSLSAVSITALGTVSRGNWITTDNAQVTLTACTFTDMGTFTFLSGTSVSGCTFRRCQLITQGGATIDGCVIDSSNNSSKALLVDDLDLITNTAFTSPGSGSAIELTTACAGQTFSLVGNTFTGYAGTDGDTGNEALFNNSSGSVTINVMSGDTPTVRNGTGASTTVVANAVDILVTVLTTDGDPIYLAHVLLTAADLGPFPYQDVVTISNSGTTATVTHNGHGLATNDKVLINGASLWQNNGVFSITYIDDNSYSYTLPEDPGGSPTGTILCTFVVLYGYTDVNGELTTSRVYSSSQPLTGRVRKSSSAPYYKTGTVVGTVSSTEGFSTTVQLVSDE